MIKKQLKAETFTSLLIGIFLFSILFVIYEKWQSRHFKVESFLYQQRQAMQISENQLSLKMAGLPCETRVKQNNITFIIQCNENKIEVKFPAGKFSLVR